MSFAPPVFNVNENPRKWRNYLDSEGYVVLTDILNSEQYSDLLETFQREFTQVSPRFSFTDSETWTIANTPAMFGKGMAIYNGFGQSDFMWKLRTNSNIQSPFKTLFNTEELVTSLDGFSVFVSDKQKSKSWLHIDENPKNDIFSIQGAYNMFPVNSGDAGFLVVPGSHKTFKPETPHKKDWIVVDQETFLPQAVKLLIPENSFTLWNSRLIHANTGMVKIKQKKEATRTPPTRINRITAYVTFLPKELRSEKIKDARIETYKDGKTTSHWSNRCEVKTYPYGFKKRYESRGFNTLEPRLTETGDIPPDRACLL